MLSPIDERRSSDFEENETGPDILGPYRARRTSRGPVAPAEEPARRSSIMETLQQEQNKEYPVSGYFDDDDEGDESKDLFEDEVEDAPYDQSNVDQQPHTVGKKETEQIFWVRGMVLLVLLLATSLVSFALYFNTRKGEINQFRLQFGDHYIKIIDSFQFNFKHTIQSMDNLGILLTTYASASNSQWPFVTLPEFEFRGPSAKTMSKAEMITFLPLVRDTQRAAWERYSIRSSSWVNQGLERFNPQVSIFQTAAKRHDQGGERTRHRRLNKIEIDIDRDSDEGSFQREDSFPDEEPYFDIYGGRQHGAENIDKFPGSSEFPDNNQNSNSPYPFPGNQGEPTDFSSGISSSVYRVDETNTSVVEPYGTGPYFPAWQMTPVIRNYVNYNLLSHPSYGDEIRETVEDGGAFVVGKGTMGSLTYPTGVYSEEPVSNIVFPVFQTVQKDSDSSRTIVGVLTATILWSDYFIGSYGFASTGAIIAVLENRCGQQYSYQIDGNDIAYLGEGDAHDSLFDDMERTLEFSDIVQANGTDDDPDGGFFTFSRIPLNTGFCPYRLRTYPSREMHATYLTWRPAVYTSAVVLTLVITSAVFMIYDCLVERRQKLVLESAMKSSAVISSLFPAVVRDRLFKDGKVFKRKKKKHKGNASPKRRLKSFLLLDDEGKKSSASNPIADLFPDTTVLFADIAGFTAWSSVRDPSQVFTLLETIYAAFDKVAKKRGVFKVETIGDCYVAVTGLPDPQEDHAVIMARFAITCLKKMNELTESLEVTLGPDTGELKLRAGLHSGPVTAGVLRGEKSRFQLFGDTVNTASRMESTGTPDQIQCSQSTADLLIAAGKAHYLCPRDELVQAKGKGEVQTYWIGLQNDAFNDAFSVGGTTGTTGSSKEDTSATPQQVRSKRDKFFSFNAGKSAGGLFTSKSVLWTERKSAGNLNNPVAGAITQRHQRLVDWNVDLLGKLLKQIIAKRRKWNSSKSVGSKEGGRKHLQYRPSTNPIKDVTEAIDMPQFDAKIAKIQTDPESIQLSDRVVSQLMEYVTTIAQLYRDANPFHNFEHATHVTMSAHKVLKRVVTPDIIVDKRGSVRQIASNLHQYTYGITSDPLTQFAIVFSALIHDVDHCGVSNGQLVKEKTQTAIKYESKSVAEQNSVDIAWNLLMKPKFADLQKCIYTNETELKRFRNLVVNAVIATDIFDPELKSFRNNRWDKAFYQGYNDANLKATIVIEHIIQASDVSHTMQHWHVYTKWNEKLFHEMYSAWRKGRGGDKDPSEGWYKGELWFFDNYVIPLAKKLKECGVFGVASAECLTYALDNRREWEANGEDIVEKMLGQYSFRHPRPKRNHKSRARRLERNNS